MRTQFWIVLSLCLLTCAGCAKKEKTTAELLDDLKGTQDRERITAVRVLPQRRGDAAQVIPGLIEALKDKLDSVRMSAALGLGSYHEEAKAAIPALQAALHDPDARVREAAAKALSRIDPNSVPVVAPKTSTRR